MELPATGFPVGQDRFGTREGQSYVVEVDAQTAQERGFSHSSPVPVTFRFLLIDLFGLPDGPL